MKTGFLIGALVAVTAAGVVYKAEGRRQKAEVKAEVKAEANADAVRPTAVPATSETYVSGVLEGSVSTPAVVFVIARDETKKGHPLLAKRIDVRAFPATFSLGPDDLMMGTPPPARIFLEARVDSDGDAATKEPGAPYASIDGVVLGSNDVTLRLSQK